VDKGQIRLPHGCGEVKSKDIVKTSLRRPTRSNNSLKMSNMYKTYIAFGLDN